MSTFGICFIIFWVALFEPCVPTKHDNLYPTRQHDPVEELHKDDFDRWQSQNDMCAVSRSNRYRPDKYCTTHFPGSTLHKKEVYLKLMDPQTLTWQYYKYNVYICKQGEQIRACLTGYQYSFNHMLWKYRVLQPGQKVGVLAGEEGICEDPKLELN